MADNAPSALQLPQFRRLWLGAVVSNAGTWMQAITVPFVIFEMTGSTAWVGTVASATLLPTLIVTPIGGALADRYPRKRVLLIANSIQACCAALLSVAWFQGVRSPLFMLMVAAFSGLFSSGTNSAWHAVISDIVPPPLVTSAVSLNSMQVSAGKAVGPALGGIILTTLGPAWAFGLNAFSFLVILGALAFSKPRAVPPRRQSGIIEGMVEGAHHVWRDPAMRRALLLTVSLTSMANPVLQLTAPLPRRVFGGGGGLVGVLVGAYGAGSVVGAVLVGRVVQPANRGRWITSMTALLGCVVIATGLTAHAAMAVPLYAIHGCVYILAMSPIIATFHLRAEPSIRGRAVSVYLVSFSSFLGLGTLGWSRLADTRGFRLPLLVAGAVLLCVGLATARRPEILDIPDRVVVHGTDGNRSVGPFSSPPAPGAVLKGSEI